MTTTKVFAPDIYPSDHPKSTPPEPLPMDTAWEFHARLNRIRGLIAKEIRERAGADLNVLLEAEKTLTL